MFPASLRWVAAPPSRRALKRAPQRLCSFSSGLPWFFVPEHGVEDGQDFAGDRNEGDHFWFTAVEQAAVEGAQHRIAATCGESRQKDARAWSGSAASDHALATPATGLVGEGCNTDKAGGLWPIEAAGLQGFGGGGG